MNKLILLIFATIIAIMPVFLIKRYIITNNITYLILAIFAYLSLLSIYIKIFRTYDLATNYVSLQVMQILATVIISYIFINDHMLANLRHTAGMIMGIISIVLLY